MFGNRIAQILPEVSHRNFPPRRSRDSSRMSSSISSPKNSTNKTMPFLWNENDNGNSLMKNASDKHVAHDNGAIVASNQPDLRKTRMCPNVLSSSSCPFSAEKCRFAHSAGDLRVSIDKFYKIQPCAFFERGKCRNGGFCRFAHGSIELRPGSVQDDAVLIGVGIYPSGSHRKHVSCASHLQSPRDNILRLTTEASSEDKDSASPLSHVCDDKISDGGLIRTVKNRTETSRTNDIVSILSLQRRSSTDLTNTKRIQSGLHRNSTSLLGEVPSSSSLSTVPSGAAMHKCRNNKLEKYAFVYNTGISKSGVQEKSSICPTKAIKSSAHLYIPSDGHTTPSTAHIDMNKGILSTAYTPMDDPNSFNDTITLSSRSTPTATETNSHSEDVCRIFSSPLPYGDNNNNNVNKASKEKGLLNSDTVSEHSGFQRCGQQEEQPTSSCHSEIYKREYLVACMTCVYED